MRPEETIDQAVRRHALERPETPAVIDPFRTVTWKELTEAADRCASHLARHGVGPGDRVAFLGPSTATYAITLLGAWRRGASILGLNFRLPPAQISAITERLRVAHVVADTSFAETAEGLVTDGLTIVAPDSSWPEPQPAVEPVRGDDEAEAMIYMTSGSTGAPKAVPLTRRAVEASMTYAAAHDFTSETRALIIPPTFHAAGATWTNYCLHVGATCIYSSDASPAGIISTINEQRVTHSILVPLLIHAVVEELKANPAPIPSLLHVGYGASPITQHLLNEALELLDCDFCQVYGLSESGGGVAFLLPADHIGENPPHLTSAGRPGEGFEVSVRDFTGEELPTGEAGELWFRGPSLTKGYIENQEATDRVLVDGWLNTRDVGFLDDDGYIFIQGRSDDMIQTGSENVHPQAVEEVLVSIPGISECAVIGVADPRWGQKVTAVVVSEDDLSEDDVIAQCRGRLATYQVPKSVVFVNEMPRTATGKIQRSVLANSIGAAAAS